MEEMPVLMSVSAFFFNIFKGFPICRFTQSPLSLAEIN